MPRAVFATQPTIASNRLNTTVSFSKQESQNISFTVTLQSLWQTDAKEGLKLEDVKIIGQGSSFATSNQPTFSKASTISLNQDLSQLGLSSQNTKVRLKVVVAQAESTPENWQQAKARVLFSEWLDYKPN